MSNSVIGDQPSNVAKTKYGVTLHNFPEAPVAQLTDSTSVLNNASQSGKRLGAQVMSVVYTDEVVTTAAVYVATGNAETDPWVLMQQVVGTGSAATVTPASS